MSDKSLIEDAIATQADFSLVAFAKALLDKFGGEDGLAEKALDVYEMSDRGSNTRKSILELVFRTMERASADLATADKIDAEDLRAEARAIFDGND